MLLPQIDKKSKLLALLVDPDKANSALLNTVVGLLADGIAQMVLVGGSLLTTDKLSTTVSFLRANTQSPIILFPGSSLHVVAEAHGILLLSLISGRNPEFLIGHQVAAATTIRQSGLSVWPTGYILIEGGTTTTVEYISNTRPIPANKPEIASVTALAGQQLGLQHIYIDAGSGAQNRIPNILIEQVANSIDIPLWVGGGLKSAADIQACWQHGANVAVVGTRIETDTTFANELRTLNRI